MKKCAKCGGSMYKTGGSTMKTTVGSAKPQGKIFGIPNAGPTGPNKQGIDTMKKGGSTSRAVKHSCPPGTVRSASGKCVSERPSLKSGGNLKTVPADKTGLSKLPTAVRNKMGYKKSGGATKKMC